MFSHVKAFNFIDIYLFHCEGVCVWETDHGPYLTVYITFQGPIFPMCVYSAAFLSLQHQNGSKSEDPLGQILCYNDRSLYEVKLRARWPLITLMGFSIFSSEHPQILS